MNGYAENRNDAEAAAERPLLRSFPDPSAYGTPDIAWKKPRIPITTRLKQYLNADIDKRHADLILIVCFFISGLIDAGAYNAYECFVSMQTGNTIFAALGVSNLPTSSPPLAWTKSVCAVLCYLLGSVVTAWFHRKFGPCKRWVLAASFTLQAIFMLISAILVGLGHSSGSSPSEGDPSLILTLPADPGFPWTDSIPIGLLSFQAAGKVIASRMLEYSALTTNVLTMLYSDFISDPALFTAGLFSNVQRNRRAGGAVMYFVGAVIGGVAASQAAGFSGGLIIAAVIQIALAAAWLLWREESGKNEDEEE